MAITMITNDMKTAEGTMMVTTVATVTTTMMTIVATVMMMMMTTVTTVMMMIMTTVTTVMALMIDSLYVKEEATPVNVDWGKVKGGGDIGATNSTPTSQLIHDNLLFFFQTPTRVFSTHSKLLKLYSQVILVPAQSVPAV